jgi:hypothetical protein
VPGFCGNWSAIAHDQEGVVHAIPLRCRSWGCPVCAGRNKRRLRQRLDGAEAYSLITLTCNPARFNHPNSAFRGMSHAIDTLIKRVRHKYPHAKVEYFLVWERTKAGWPHCHIVFNGPYLPQRWLSHAWKEIIGAPIVDVRRISSHNELVSYVSKYLSKDPQVPTPMKRYRSSRGFFAHLVAPPPGVDAEKLRWSLEPCDTLKLGQQLSRRGYSCRMTSDSSLTAYPKGHPDAPITDCFASWLAVSR